jgi:N-acetylmuramoyl-L-alanine amidase
MPRGEPGREGAQRAWPVAASRPTFEEAVRLGDLPLRTGSAGEAVRDVQRRLSAVGEAVPATELGRYGEATAAAVRAFQRTRHLREDGICGKQTWAALVEAGYTLGDRMLYRHAPMQRGDDVAEVQRRLSALGFDAGKVDGIFGHQTERALLDFQRNAGLTVDGICGPATVRALRHLGQRGEPVAGVREREALRVQPPTLTGRRVVLAHSGGLAALAWAVDRELVHAGAQVAVLEHPEGSDQAAGANALGAEVFVGLELDPDGTGCRTAYFSGFGGESPAGRRLAELAQEALPLALGVKDGGVEGLSLPVLRETRMPAVVCELGPAAAVVERGAEVARALRAALVRWAEQPC